MLNRKVVACMILCCLLCSCGKAGETPLDAPDLNGDQTVSDEAATEASDIEDIYIIDDSLTGDIDITTPYVTLKFPERWLNCLKVEKVYSDEDPDRLGRVNFYSAVGSRDKMLIFTVHFNEDGESLLGTLDLNGESIYIAFTYGELAFDNSWSQWEKDIVCGMQEEINYIVDNLKLETGFVSEE